MVVNFISWFQIISYFINKFIILSFSKTHDDRRDCGSINRVEQSFKVKDYVSSLKHVRAFQGSREKLRENWLTLKQFRRATVKKFSVFLKT